MTGETKPFGIILGLMGNFAMAWGISKLVANGSCGGELPACPDSLNSAFLLVFGGIFVSMAGIFFGGGVFSFFGIFISIGIGSIIAGLDSDESFGLVFGGFFAGVPILLILVLAVLGLGGKAKAAKAQNLIATGARGIGTITGVRDTGVTINDNPRVGITMRIEPEDGSPAFDATKDVTVSRVAIPRRGDRFPVWYDRADPTSWAYGTDMDRSQTAPENQALFDKAAADPELAELDALAKLHDLHRAGALTDAEFEAAKGRLLNPGRP